MTLLLSLDQGTTSSRAILFDPQGQVLASVQKDFQQYYPRPGWVEHDAEALVDSQLACARELLQQTPQWREQVVALGIANQRETTVVWERASGRPIGPAIVWQDRRTAQHCEQLRNEGWSARVRAITGLELDPYFSATKVAWLLDHVPGARARAERGELAFGTIDSWLIWQLTRGGCHVTDVSNASRTMLFDIHRMCWSEALLSLFDVPESMLPRVVDSIGVCARTHESVLGAEMPIAGVAGDQQAATFGQACWSPGMAKNTYGTGCFLLVNTGDMAVQSRNRLLTTVGWRRVDQATVYALEGSVFVGGAVVQWLRDELGMIRDASEVESLARSVPDSGGVVLVPAFTGLGAPYWDPHARGTLMGLTRGSNRAQIARAALEAIALQTVDLVAAMDRDGATLQELRVDGGAAGNNLLMQMQADLLGVPVIRPALLETTALGAAYMAGLGVGVWDSVKALDECWRADRVFEPQWSADRREGALHRWQRAVERARDWADD